MQKDESESKETKASMERKRLWRERKRLLDCRKKAKRAMKDLTSALETIQKTSRHPDQDFARIFQDENLYFTMVRACHSAYDQSILSKIGLFSLENLKAIQYECHAAGLFPSAKQLSDRHFRNRILKELAAKEVEPGFSYLERLRVRILDLKERKRKETEKPLNNLY